MSPSDPHALEPIEQPTMLSSELPENPRQAVLAGLVRAAALPRVAMIRVALAKLDKDQLACEPILAVRGLAQESLVLRESDSTRGSERREGALIHLFTSHLPLMLALLAHPVCKLAPDVTVGVLNAIEAMN